MIDEEQMNILVREILDNTPYEPFLCLPLSAKLYQMLTDKYQAQCQIVTGHLLYQSEFMFKQDFSIKDVEPGCLRSWAGHAWVEIDDFICDLSFFRTLYSDEFSKPCKARIIDQFGTGCGCIIATRDQLVEDGFSYQSVDQLDDDLVTAIISGYSELPIWDQTT